MRKALPPLIELVTPIPYTALQQMFNGSAPWGILAYEKAVYLEELSDAAIDVILEQQPRKAFPLSFLPIFVLGGAFHRPALICERLWRRGDVLWVQSAPAWRRPATLLKRWAVRGECWR